MGSLSAVGCGGSVSLADAEAAVGASGTGAGASGPCDPGGAPALPEVEITAPGTGVFVDGFLHLAARLDGKERYLVIAIQGGAGYVVATPDELIGPANLARVGAGVHARLRGSGDTAWIDVVDTSRPDSPVLSSSVAIDGDVPASWRGVFSVVGERLLACVRPEPGADPVLAALPLAGDAPPETLAEGSGQPCSEWTSDAAGLAAGETWIGWRTGENGGLGGYLEIFDASTAPIQALADYNYSPDGVHAYGSVVSVATDGSHIVFDIGNDSRFFLYELGSEKTSVTHAWFGLDGPKKLLGVAQARAYIATAAGVRVFDVSTIPDDPPTDDWPPPLLDDHADVAFGDGLATAIAVDAEQLLVADSEGRLFSIPLHPAGATLPLRFYMGSPPAPEPGCK